MPTRQRLLTALLILSVLVIGNVMELVALGASLWLSSTVSSQVSTGWSCSSGSNECRSSSCQCPPGRCRGGEHCGCGQRTPDRKVAIQRFRIPCHEPPPPLGLYEPQPRQKHLLSGNAIRLSVLQTSLLPWLSVYQYSIREHVSSPVSPPPQHA